MAQEISCGILVIRKHQSQREILLIQSRQGGHWSFPKGHMEPGELESHTAEREVLEETGLKVKVDRRYRAENRYNIRTDIQKLVVIFAAVTTQKEITPQPEEIAEAKWYPVEEALGRLTYERDRKILRAALVHVEKYYEHRKPRQHAPASQGQPG